jgi:hypothetical protein
MAYKVTVVELKPTVGITTDTSTSQTQVYEQSVDTLDLPKVIAAVNYKKRERKPRTPATPTK